MESIDGRSVAVVHGDYLERGGAEHVSQELAKLYDAPLYYGFGKPDSELSTEAVTTHSIYNDALTAPLLKRSILLRDAYYMWNAQFIEDLYKYDILLFSKNELGWFVPRDEQVTLHYLHTTPRTPYDQFYEKGDSVFSRLYSFAARVLYLPNTKYPDKFIANSELVARRAKRYWGIPEHKLEVVYPPVDVNKYSSRDKQDYYLTFSRLIPAKRIDEIVRAFDGLNANLVVGGTGQEEDKLKRIAPENVEFVGYMPDDEKVRRLGEARAIIFNAKNEDFGIVPIEAFASGTPVIGVRDGYTKYQILDGKNGLLHEPGVESIRDAVRRFERDGVSWSAAEITEFAEQYGLIRFKEEIQEVVQQTIEEVQIDPHGS